MTSKVKGTSRPSGDVLRSFHNRIGQALIKRHRADFDVGRLLDEALSGRFWQYWPYQGPDGLDRDGYPSLEKWCQDLFGYGERKCYSLRSNYLLIDALGMDEEGPTFARLLRVGWTKIEQILKAARNESDVISWLDAIEDDSWSFKKLYGEVEMALSGYERPEGFESVPPLDEEDLNEDDEPEDVDDDGLEDDEDDDEGIEDETVIEGDDDDFEVETYDSLDTRQPISRSLKKTGKARIPLRCVFTQRDSYDIYLKAREHIGENYPGIGDGEAIGLLSTNYLSTQAKHVEGGPAVTLEYMIQSIEHTHGVRLEVVKDVPAQ